MNRRLYRSVDERMLAGVAAGMAEWLDVDPSIVRLVWVVAAIGTAGMAILVYIAMAIVIPEEPYTTPGGAPRSAAADAPTTPVPPEVPGVASPAEGDPIAPPSGARGGTASGLRLAAWRDRLARSQTRRARRSAGDPPCGAPGAPRAAAGRWRDPPGSPADPGRRLLARPRLSARPAAEPGLAGRAGRHRRPAGVPLDRHGRRGLLAIRLAAQAMSWAVAWRCRMIGREGTFN